MSSKLTAASASALANFSNLPDEAIVRLPVVCPLVGVSRVTIWRRVRADEFPSPVRLSAGAVGWRVGDLRKYLRDLGAQPAA